MNDNKNRIAIRIFAILISVSVIVLLAVSAYLSTRPWLFAGEGIPDTVYLREGYRLERVISFRQGYHVEGIADGAVFWSSANANGAVKPDDSGNTTVLYEQPDISSAETESYRVIADTPDGRAVYDECCDIGGLTVITGGKLGVIDDDGTAAYLFPSDKGGSWSLDEPRVYGDMVVVRIYFCDTVYRLVGDRGSLNG